MKQHALIKHLNLSIDPDIFLDSFCEQPIYIKSKNKIILKFKTKKVIPYADYRLLQESLSEVLKASVDLMIESETDDNDELYYLSYLNHFLALEPRFSYCSDFSWVFLSGKLSVLATNQNQFEQLQAPLSYLNSSFTHAGFHFSCECDLKELDHVENIPTFSISNIAPTKPVQLNRFNNRNQYDLIKISDLKEEIQQVMVEGICFSITERTTSSGKSNEYTYFVHNYEDAFQAVQYLKVGQENEVKVNDRVMVYGNYEYDGYWKKHIFRVKKIERLNPLPGRIDEAFNKRSEFHAHTKYSEMDGVCDVADLIKQAYDFGFEAIAITDHAVVHGFPTAQKVAKQLNSTDPNHQIKVVYGCEMNVVADELAIIKQVNQDVDLMHANTVIFDLETTGLSSKRHEIIEFGAVKMVDGVMVDKKQLFIKPKQAVPSYIQKITNITNEMLEQAPSLEKAFDEILEFIGDAILVAHNATFDMSFLQAAAKQLNRPPLQNAVIDTLPMSWCLVENRRSFTLGSIARYYKIIYDSNIAHRADYDAEILYQVYSYLLQDAKRQSVATSFDLQQFQKQQTVYDKAREYHAICLIKNQKGLKALYELVSLSHTSQLMYRGKSSKKEDESLAQPRIMRKEINRLRENLLIGSACYNSYLFEVAKTGSDEELLKELDFYDYIEIQPLENYEPLIYRKSFERIDEVVKLIKHIIAMAKQKKKLIIATGDVHYLNPKDKIFREIYINAMGIGGAKHPLYIYDNFLRQTQQSPNQYLKNTEEMLQGFPYLSAAECYEYVVENPKKLSSMIEVVEPIGKDLYPPFIDRSDEKLRSLCYENARKLYGNPLPKIVEKRLEKELLSIIGNGYGVVYYISHLLVNKSNQDGYMVGSRGSVGSSFAATMAGITEVNPLMPHYRCPHCLHSEFFDKNEYASGYDLPSKTCPHCGTVMIGEGQDIPFETFLGFEGDKVPDIDLNFSGDYQEVAHNYTKELFGEDKVLRAGTIGTIADKTAFGLVSGYYESINHTSEVTQAYREYLAMHAAGVKRSTGQHPGGIVVVPANKDILDFVPYQYPANNPEATWMTTHFEYHDIESNLLKLDILGHVDPTSMKFLEEVSGLDVTEIPMNDPQTLSLFHSTSALKIDETQYLEKNGALGLPEFGTQFVRRMLNDTKPKQFSDLVRISGLSHGTDVWNNNASDLIQEGLTLQDVIGCRDDIMTFLIHKGLEAKMAFQIMESVRKGKGLKPDWILAMTEHHVSNWYIESAQKIKYLFPKAHAVAYCMMGFRVAWFKVHRPLDFYAQYFSLRCDAFELSTMMAGVDSLKQRINDIKQKISKREASKKEEQLLSTFEVSLEFYLRGFSFTPLDLVNSTATKFWPNPDNPKQLLMPYNRVDGLGDGVALNIVAEREIMPFLSIEDLKKRTGINQSALNELKKLKVLESLSETNQLSFF